MENTILSTRNYDIFKFLHNNRELARGHVEALRKAFEETGNLTRVQPILVNENMQIIDGQHRFTVAKELGEPIFYIVSPGLTVTDARSMNILHRNWTIDDFARSYADGGDSNYIRYLILLDTFNVSHTTLLSYINNEKKERQYSEFRAGDFSFTSEQQDAAIDKLSKLTEILEFLPVGRDNHFTLAYLQVLNVPDFNQKRMLTKAKRLGGQFKRYATIVDYLRALEELYNYQHTEANRVRLY
jgi:hypothetical protein